MKEVAFAISRSYMVVVDQMPIMKMVVPKAVAGRAMKMPPMMTMGAKSSMSDSKECVLYMTTSR